EGGAVVARGDGAHDEGAEVGLRGVGDDAGLGDGGVAGSACGELGGGLGALLETGELGAQGGFVGKAEGHGVELDVDLACGGGELLVGEGDELFDAPGEGGGAVDGGLGGDAGEGFDAADALGDACF